MKKMMSVLVGMLFAGFATLALAGDPPKDPAHEACAKKAAEEKVAPDKLAGFIEECLKKAEKK
ncbi:MAG: hypothetical protein HQL74_11720 [Magnetococcales bacterium]|nr:hypothetical protein [Magnetococcales bacterium]MBF0420698.1 hypothetical protein [Magnetococcales bacterium]